MFLGISRRRWVLFSIVASLAVGTWGVYAVQDVDPFVEAVEQTLEKLARSPQKAEQEQALSELSRHASADFQTTLEVLELSQLYSVLPQGTFESLLNQVGPAAVGPAADALSASELPLTKVLAARTIAAFSASEHAELIRSILANPDAEVFLRSECALSLRDLRAVDTTSTLLRVAEDTKAPVRLRESCLVALADLDPTSLEWLGANLLSADIRPDDRTIRRLLSCLAYCKRTGPILDRLRREQDLAIMCRLVAALLESGTEGDLLAVEEIAAVALPDDLARAILRNVQPANAAELRWIVTSCLSSASKAVRLAAIAAAIRGGTDTEQDVLIEWLLASDGEAARYAYNQAVSQLGG